MNVNMYVISAVLILMVVRQIREHPLDLRSLAAPVLAVGCAAVLFLHSVPGGGNDVALELACVLAGAVMGALGGLTARLRLGTDGRPFGRACALAASMWVGGVGARLAFAVAAGNGAGPAITRFSIAHQITGSAAWAAHCASIDARCADAGPDAGAERAGPVRRLRPGEIRVKVLAAGVSFTDAQLRAGTDYSRARHRRENSCSCYKPTAARASPSRLRGHQRCARPAVRSALRRQSHAW